MSQIVEEGSFYDVPLESMKRKSTQEVGQREEFVEKKAKIENVENVDGNKIENEAGIEDEQVVPQLPANSGKDEEDNEAGAESPKNPNKLIGDVQVNPDPFELIEQIRREDFSDSETESQTIYYDSDSDSSEYELQYFEVTSLWINMNDSDIEE